MSIACQGAPTYNLPMNTLRRICWLLLVAAVTLIASCRDSGSDSTLLSTINVQNPTIALQQANDLGMKGSPVTSYLLNDRIAFEDANGETLEVPLPDDVMVLAIAPFIENTHACRTHNISSCRGELPLSDFTVSVQQIDGDFAKELTLSTLENGFLELWLPKNGTYAVTIADGQLQAFEELSTFSSDRTCITTMQLQKI